MIMTIHDCVKWNIAKVPWKVHELFSHWKTY